MLMDQKFFSKPFEIGLMMSMMSLTTAIISSQLGKLTTKFGGKGLLTVSFIFYGIALMTIPLPTKSIYLIFPLIIYGIGHGLNIPSIQTLLAEIAPLEYRGAFMSMNGMLLRLGQTLGPLIMGLFFVLGQTTLVFTAGSVLAFLMVLPLLIKRK